MLIAPVRPFYGLRGGFLFGSLLRLGSEPAPVAPTLQELEEEAAIAALERTEAQHEAGYCCKGQINIGDPDVTIEKTAIGAEKKFSRLFFSYARKNEAQKTGLSILWDGQPLASESRSLWMWSLLFEHNAVQIVSWLARPEPSYPVL